MYYVYILYSHKLKQLYKGSSSNLRDRISAHNSGQVTSTRNDRPWILLYYECFNKKTDALREELFLKTGKGRERIKYLLKEII